MTYIKRLFAILIISCTFVLLISGCGKAEVLMNRKQIDEKVEKLFSAKTEAQEWEIAVETANFFNNSGIKVKVVFKIANQVEYLEPMRYVSEKEAVTIIMIADDVYIWKPLSRKNVDAFFLE